MVQMQLDLPQPPRREVAGRRVALGGTNGELKSIERYRDSQGRARHAAREAARRPHPLEFDESGFPIAQERPSLVERVARLLSQD